MTALLERSRALSPKAIEIVTLKAPASLDVGEDPKIHGIYATPQMISAIKDGRYSVASRQAAGCPHPMRHPHQRPSDRISSPTFLRRPGFLVIPRQDRHLKERRF